MLHRDKAGGSKSRQRSTLLVLAFLKIADIKDNILLMLNSMQTSIPFAGLGTLPYRSMPLRCKMISTSNQVAEP